MLNRALFLTLAVWLLAATGLKADAGPCHAVAADPVMEADHYAMMEADAPPPDEAPGKPANAICCCPAMIAGIAPPRAPEASVLRFSLPAPRFAETAASFVTIPEPPPPKA